jgi:acyl carrier protein
MPEPDSLDQQVIELIAQKKKLPPESVTLDSTFVELGIDSLDGMDLLFTFEETFKLSIPDEVAQQMKTVRQVTEALRAALAANPQPSAN